MAQTLTDTSDPFYSLGNRIKASPKTRERHVVVMRKKPRVPKQEPKKSTPPRKFRTKGAPGRSPRIQTSYQPRKASKGYTNPHMTKVKNDRLQALIAQRAREL